MYMLPIFSLQVELKIILALSLVFFCFYFFEDYR